MQVAVVEYCVQSLSTVPASLLYKMLENNLEKYFSSTGNIMQGPATRTKNNCQLIII